MNRDEKKLRIARRVARELRDGDVVNLGIGLPTLVAQFIPPGLEITLQSENGILGMRSLSPGEPEDAELTNAGGGLVGIGPGSSFFDTLTSFGMIRGGYVDVAVLGALEVDARGNLANWMVPGKRVPGIGGAMDLAVGARRLIVATEHVTPDGSPKLLSRCTLPLTAQGAVDLIVTELAVLECAGEHFRLLEIAPDISLEVLQKVTGAPLLSVGEPSLMA